MGRTVNKAVSAARREQRDAQALWREHQRGCYPCHRAVIDTNYTLACDAGWELAKAAQAARIGAENAAEAAAAGNGTDQLGLF